ncbi:hypothetical protein [Effusibacillus consociatus]|uniref:Glycosyl transferase family 4 n=1 Tax=Effusibacillus consociatus TaxID=1117041 RepID=A0ABV9Q5S5_9BACL
MGGMQTNLAGFILSAAGCLLCAGMTRMLIPSFCEMARTANWVRPNYKGDLIPVGVGAVMLLAFVAVGVLMLAAEKFVQLDTRMPEILLLAFGMSFLGLLDDTLGSRDIGGFKGHVRKLSREGELTTGFLKAAGGILLAFGTVIAGIPGDKFAMAAVPWLSILADTLIIALMANWINLLDVRPGRALKGGLLKILILLPFVSPGLSVSLMMAAGVVVAYFPADLRAKAMMGDVGANFIGAVLGYLIAQTFDLGVKAILLLLLAGLHFYTESRSLSKVIEKNKWLSWVDHWGREEAR